MQVKERGGRAVQRRGSKWKLMLYDAVLLSLVWLAVLVIYPKEMRNISAVDVVVQIGLINVCVLGARLALQSYRQIWRYAGVTSYLRLILCDAVGGALFCLVYYFLIQGELTLLRVICSVCANLIMSIGFRYLYQYIYESASRLPATNQLIRKIASVLTGLDIEREVEEYRMSQRKINIAIVGAGRTGVTLADELLNNPNASYRPVCFIDVDKDKVGRYIHGIQVLSEEQGTLDLLADLSIKEIVFALPSTEAEKRMELCETYKKTGCRLKTYDFPVTQSISSTTAKSKRHLRAFAPEELLFRNAKDFITPETRAYYEGKTVLISGGGGSIGSELCRQIAKMHPKRLIVLDIYENNAYDLQQELKIAYGDQLDLQVEIITVCDRNQLEQVFKRHRPDVVLHAAAHKHVPLMETNCCEAVKNNVFGTFNIVELSEQYHVEKFIMISTDKAVNPTNVMGATKRMCEMIVQSKKGTTKFSATRFGNVLGSNGSVIPLFSRQIAAGGPITLTDRRIIRYFMTIPEASQLVLASGAMAQNGELYVLDMGQPVKILDLAENMIRLSGYQPYKDIDIVETGLRPGEKLYEELLIKTEDLDRTDNNMIFIERDHPLCEAEVLEKLEVLRKAVETEDNEVVRKALQQVVPTYRTPDEVNATASKAAEMNNIRKVAAVL